MYQINTELFELFKIISEIISKSIIEKIMIEELKQV